MEALLEDAEWPAAAQSRPIVVLSRKEVPAATPVYVDVRYVEHGARKHLRVAATPPTRFDQIIVSEKQAVLPAMAGSGSWRRRAYQYARRASSFFRGPREIAPCVLDMRDKAPNNIAHLILDLMPYVLYARDQIGKQVILLTREIDPRFQPLLDIFGVDAICDYGKVSAPTIRIHGTRGLAIYELQSAFDTFGIQFAPHVYNDFEAKQGAWPERIFLARRDARRLLNHDRVEALAMSARYQTIYMEDYSIAEQLSIGTHAKHVIAIHGAAMAYLIMAQNIESVVELMPPNVYHEFFPVCLGSKVRRYAQILPEFDFSTVQNWADIHRYKNSPFSTDLTELQGLLSRIHSSERELPERTDSVADAMAAG